LQNQADGICPAIDLDKLTAFVVLPYVGQDRPLAVIRRIANPLVT